MTNTTDTKHPVRTALILITFVFAIAAIAWVSIKIVNNVPGTFASLASLAETVKEYDTSTDENASQDMLIVTSDTNVVVAGESVRLSWTETTTPGSYVLSYGCTDGVAIDLQDTSGSRSISCDTNYNLGNSNSVSLRIDSEKSRYVDIPYTLSFLATNDTAPRASDDAILTVVNSQIASIDDSDTESETAEEESESTPTETPVDSTPNTNPTPTTPTYTQEFTYQIPVSDPNGRIDLGTRYLNVGRIVGNQFIAQVVDNDLSGAIQFEVKNFGTKTSNKWTYTVTLPSGGIYESSEQTALKPNERAVITIGFPESTVRSHEFEVTITTTGDVNRNNDDFSQSVAFKD